MTRAFEEKGRRIIAWTLLAMLYFETVIPAYALGVRNAPPPATFTRKAPKVPAAVPVADASPRRVEKPEKAPPAPAPKPFNGGPTQPESQAFQSVNSANMVDLFTGDFSYNIPLIDVGGYPLGLGYSSGIGMDQEASWCGLGWNINPGSILRNLRGIPDDFNGDEKITKSLSIKDNNTYGGSAGAVFELAGFPMKSGLKVGLGVFHNSYNGWGVETMLMPSVNVGSASFGTLTAGLSLTNNSQEGFSASSSLGYTTAAIDGKDAGMFKGTANASLGYNSRSGMKALQFSGGVQLTQAIMKDIKDDGKVVGKDQIGTRTGSSTLFSSRLSFASPSFTPSISVPWTSASTAINIKAGGELKILASSLEATGYWSKQTIEPEDRVQQLPAYGYLHYEKGKNNPSALLDFNREREIPYRDESDVPNIAIPSYTYDIFSMSGEGTGGTFRAYRSDIGFVHDHHMHTRDKSFNGGADVAFGDLAHIGVDLAASRSRTDSDPWTGNNPLAENVAFTNSDKLYEAAYFRNPGEKTVVNGNFHNAIGGDDVVYPEIRKNGGMSPLMATTGQLARYRGGRTLERFPLPAASARKEDRDKRTQVISYLNAEEASEVGFPKLIENYGMNQTVEANCETEFPIDTEQEGTGLKWDLYTDAYWGTNVWIGKNTRRLDWPDLKSFRDSGVYLAQPQKNFAQRWYGRIKATYTGKYQFNINADDAQNLRVNGLLISTHWESGQDGSWTHRATPLYLEEGKVYDFTAEHANYSGKRSMYKLQLEGHPFDYKSWYWPAAADTFVAVPGKLFKEKRLNDFRKKNHLSQIDVLNNDGMRYVYGLPVYNLSQKEVTFAAKKENGNRDNGTVTYDPATDATLGANKNGQDNYYSSETLPAYAHTFLLTGILSSDYVDVTGNGISDDDPGNAIKFNYTKTAGARNPYKWRTPNGQVAGYNEGLRTDSRDDKGSYVYGTKELWYLHSIESKNMIATFTLEDRDDMFSVLEDGTIETGNNSAKRLKEINLYSKAEFQKFKDKARPVKTVHFEYTYELCRNSTTYPGRETGKLTLKKVWFSYNGNKKGQKNAYVFNYSGANPQYNSQASDRWGTFKNPADNPGSVSGNTVSNAEFPYSVQDSAVAARNAAAWSLDSIHLPSGGRIKVTYESDEYAFVQNRRAGIMCNVAGFSKSMPTQLSQVNQFLYGNDDHLYISIHVPEAVHSVKEIDEKYLQGMTELYFRLNVNMPTDRWGSGAEFVSGYATLEPGQYGFYNSGKTIWLKVKSVDKSGDYGGKYSPFAKTAAQFVRLNLPTKAYPGMDMGDNLGVEAAVQLIAGMATGVVSAFRSFDNLARANKFGQTADLKRSFVRLYAPAYRKMGGGLRVKSIKIYDHWNAMTKQKESLYGTEYLYTKLHDVGGKKIEISSGVATYEPMMGGEENMWREPIKYTDQAAKLAPVTLGYVDMPLGETFFPHPSVGYSKVRTRSLRTEKTRSANGFEESTFYTAYDFPVFTDHSLLNEDAKERYTPKLLNMLKINAVNVVGVTQGFKIELNDMHGKPRSQASYSQLDSKEPITSTTYYYRVDDQNAEHKRLRNDVLSMGANGQIDGTAIVGKDMELMLDMRQQRSVSLSVDFNANVDIFSFPMPFLLSWPSGYVFPQRQETMFRSAAATKVIYRHGLLDSVVAVDKGSRVTTHNMLYDAETGDVILTSAQNEFDDTLYNFKYPAGWMYDGMAGAYKNISAVFEHVYFREGKIVGGIAPADINKYFTGGDELLVYSRNPVNQDPCQPILATFPSAGKIWAVDASANTGDAPEIFFQDADGKPFNGHDAYLKIIRSGRRNIAALAGSVSMMVNPLRQIGNGFQLQIDENSRITHAEMIEFKQSWQVEDKKKQKIVCFF
ncbi:PA14 domain-containing protein [Chitinophaga sp. NPDC101104]|uniref:PA14 domain-containing protein n=1 Tax=Chitinophaga sp. NPDC101104 TaxID=3390561 RepID=UPI003D0711B5